MEVAPVQALEHGIHEQRDLPSSLPHEGGLEPLQTSPSLFWMWKNFV
jgi:hypothetical protein